MKEYVLTVTSTCDLTKEYIKENNISFIPFNYSIDGKNYKDNFFEDLPRDDFFASLKNHHVVSSQPSPDDYFVMWEKIAKDGKDILHLEMSSGLSGGYNSALIARDLLKTKYSDVVIEVVDSRCASSGFGLLVQLAVEKKKEFGETITKLKKYLDDVKLKIHHILFTDDLTQYYRGGRVSKVQYAIGSILNIIPIIDVNQECQVGKMYKARGYKNAINIIIDKIKQTAEGGVNYIGRFLISASNPKSKFVLDTMSAIKDVFKNADFIKTKIYEIGAVMGVHTGTGTVAVFYIGNNRMV